MLPALKTEANRLLQILLGRFIKVDAIQSVESNLSIIDFSNQTLHLADEELGAGHETWRYTSEEDYRDNVVKGIFFSGAKDF